MSAASNYLESTLLKHLMRNAGSNGANYDTASLSFFLSLHTADPTDVTSVALANEISGAAYARQALTFGAVPSEGTGTGAVANNATVSFPAATSDYSGNVTHVGIFDASTSGNLLWYAALGSAKDVNEDDVFQVNSGSLTITLA